MATKKLQWSRAHIMQHQYGATKRAACWAAVIEAALAYYAKNDKTLPLSHIEQEFETGGGKFGAHGIKDFAAALEFFKLHADSRKGADKFNGKYPQVFNYIKAQIDKGNPVLLGFEMQVVGGRHAGMVFGYDEPGKLFFIEPARLAQKQAGDFLFDEKVESHYVSNAVAVETLFTAQMLRDEGASGPALIMAVDSMYQLKAPMAAGQGNLLPAVINSAAAPAS